VADALVAALEREGRSEVVGMIVDGLRDGRRELRYDLQKAELALR